MNNYIYDNRDVLEANHYLRKARQSDFWFDFAGGKLEKYKSRFGSDFCMVIFTDDAFDNAYILPYRYVATFFSVKQVDPNRNRWTGEIKDHVMRLRPGNATLSVSEYYNAFHFLHHQARSEEKVLHDAAVIYDAGEEIRPSDLRKLIQEFNDQYEDSVPHKRILISEQIGRPGAIADYLKKLHHDTCQICGLLGFDQRNGTRYSETHHITPLHRLQPSSYCSDNIIVVCPTCHMKLHYAEVSYGSPQGSSFEVRINGNKHIVKRNVISGSKRR